MEKTKISTDSTADIPSEICEELNISVLPLTIQADAVEYLDGLNIVPQEFYKVLETSKKMLASSQVTVERYMKLCDKTWRKGYSDLLHVALNSKGSGTYQAAILSRKMFYEAHPEAAGRFRIHIIDSLTYSMGYGIAVIEAAQMAKRQIPVEKIISHVQDWLAHVRPMFVPLDLKYVKKSGRISPAAAFVGDILGMKPLITFENGEARIITKARGIHNAIAMLARQCISERCLGTAYALVYGCNLTALSELKEMLLQNADIPPLAEYRVGSVISMNTGPNMIGIIYRT